MNNRFSNKALIVTALMTISLSTATPSNCGTTAKVVAAGAGAFVLYKVAEHADIPKNTSTFIDDTLVSAYKNRGAVTAATFAGSFILFSSDGCNRPAECALVSLAPTALVRGLLETYIAFRNIGRSEDWY